MSTKISTIDTITSPALKDALARVSPTFDKLRAHYDAISHDIRELESYFQDCGVYFEHYVATGEGQLGWAEVNGKMRIAIQSSEPDAPPKSLLESKINVRLLMHKHLPQLVTSLGALLAEKTTYIITEASTTPKKKDGIGIMLRRQKY